MQIASEAYEEAAILEIVAHYRSYIRRLARRQIVKPAHESAAYGICFLYGKEQTASGRIAENRGADVSEKYEADKANLEIQNDRKIVFYLKGGCQFEEQLER